MTQRESSITGLKNVDIYRRPSVKNRPFMSSYHKFRWSAGCARGVVLAAGHTRNTRHRVQFENFTLPWLPMRIHTPASLL